MILKWVVKVQNVNVESVFKQVAHPARADSSKNSLKHELIEGITTPSWREHSIWLPWQFAGAHFYFWVGKSTLRVKCFAKKHNTHWPSHVSNPDFTVTLKFSKLTMYMQYATLSPKRIL